MKYGPEGVATGMVAVAFSVSLEDRAWCLEQGRCVATADLSSSGLRWSFWASNLVFSFVKWEKRFPVYNL